MPLSKSHEQVASEILYFYRHSYSFLIDWEELKKLVVPLEQLWQTVKGEFNGFVETLTPTNE